MAVPTVQEIRLPLLEHAVVNEYRFKDMVEALENHFSLTAEERKELTNGGYRKFYDRCSNAQDNLKKAGLLESAKPGHHKITTHGLQVLRQNPESIDNNLLKQLRLSLEATGDNPIPENPPQPPLGAKNDMQLNFTEDEETILNAIETPSSHIDTIVRTTRLPIAKVSSLLSVLELKGIVEQMPGKQFRKVEREMNLDPLLVGGWPSGDTQTRHISQKSVPHSVSDPNDSGPVVPPPALSDDEHSTIMAVETHSVDVNTRGRTAQEPIVTARRTAWDPVTKKGYEIVLPASEEVQRALLDIEYPLHGIRIRDAMEKLAKVFSLTAEQVRATKSKKNSHRIFYDRVHYQLSALVKSGKLIRLDSGRFTSSGQNLQRVGMPIVETEDRGDVSARLDSTIHYAEKHKVDDPTPYELMETSYQEIRGKLATRLLEQIADNSSSFFGKLVINLLVKMAYGGSPQDVESIGRSDDGGIEGIVNEDKFGFELVYIQAKWLAKTVGQSDVQKFALAMREHQTRKGIFITPSDFSEEAREYVIAIDSKIVLIDGHQLAQFMIDYNVGASTVKTYEIKHLDSDYFIEVDASQAQDS